MFYLSGPGFLVHNIGIDTRANLAPYRTWSAKNAKPTKDDRNRHLALDGIGVDDKDSKFTIFGWT